PSSKHETMNARSVHEIRGDGERRPPVKDGGDAVRRGGEGIDHDTDLSKSPDTRDAQLRMNRLTAQVPRYGRTFAGIGFPSRSRRTIGAIFVAASGSSIFARSHTITIARWSGSMRSCAARTTSSDVTAVTPLIKR